MKPVAARGPRKKAPTKTLRTYHHGNLREALLTSAREIVLVEGTRALTVRELARRAGVSHSAPAHHFGDRSGILAALATRGFEGLARAMEAEAKGAPDPEAHLSSLGLGYLRFALEEPALMEVMFHEEAADALRFPALVEARGRAYQLLVEGVRAVVPEEAEAIQADIALAAWSLVHGFAALERAGATARRGAKGVSRATAARLVALLMRAVVRPDVLRMDRPRSGR